MKKWEAARSLWQRAVYSVRCMGAFMGNTSQGDN